MAIDTASTPKPLRCKLDHVSIVTEQGKPNLEIILSGNEFALAEAQRKLNEQPQKDKIGFVLVERPDNTKTLKITTAAEPVGLVDIAKPEKPAVVMEAIYDITHCDLSYIHMQAETRRSPASTGKVKYEGVIRVEPIPDLRDRANRAGYFSMEIIRRKQEKNFLGGLVVDPYNIEPGTLHLLHVTNQYDDAKQALQDSNDAIHMLKTHYPIRNPKSLNLRLVGVRRERVSNAGIPFHLDGTPLEEIMPAKFSRSAVPRFVTTATLAGDETALSEADKQLTRAFPRRTFRKAYSGDRLNLSLMGDIAGDPVRLVQKVHGVTHCALPVDIIAGVDPATDGTFYPALSAAISDEVPARDRAGTAQVIAHYVGLQVPCGYHITVSETPEHGAAPRIIIGQSYATGDEALKAAQSLRSLIVNEFNKRKGLRPGVL